MREAALDVASMAQDLDQGVRARGDGPPRRLDRRRRRASPAQAPAMPPHIILFPEIAVRRGRSSSRAVEAMRRASTATASSCVSEGAARRRRQVPRRGRHARTRSATRSSAASAPVVAQHGARSARLQVPLGGADYLQRAARHIASKVDVEQAYAVGKAAVELAREGHERGDADDRAQVGRSPTAGRSARCRSTRSRTSRRSCRATSSPRTASASPQRAAATSQPLIAGEDYPPYKDGLPRLRAAEERRR